MLRSSCSAGLHQCGIIMPYMSNVAVTRYDAALVRERTHRASAASDVTRMKNDMERSDEY